MLKRGNAKTLPHHLPHNNQSRVQMFVRVKTDIMIH